MSVTPTAAAPDENLKSSLGMAKRALAISCPFCFLPCKILIWLLLRDFNLCEHISKHSYPFYRFFFKVSHLYIYIKIFLYIYICSTPAMFPAACNLKMEDHLLVFGNTTCRIEKGTNFFVACKP